MSFEALYHQHVDLVYNLALHYCHRVEDAEEITQDVFVKMAEALDDFRGEAKISTWLYRMTVNAAIDHQRYHARKRRGGGAQVLALHDVHDRDVPQSFDHPGVAIEDREAMAQLFAHIDRLSPKQKTSLLLLKVEGLSQREAAEILDSTPKAVESLFERAKRNLAAMLDKAKESPSQNRLNQQP